MRIYQDEPGTGNMKFSFEAGEQLAAADAGLAVTYKAAVNEVKCAGSIELVPREVTDALLVIADDGSCTLLAEARHDAQTPHRTASIGGTVLGVVRRDAFVRAVSRDDPPKPVPDPIVPDEAGSFLLPLMPGRYDIELVAGEVVLDRNAIELVPGAELIIELQP